jgi:membrane-anchored glycerophosphoryl diester phosphodiesterase (GDPDase)
VEVVDKFLTKENIVIAVAIFVMIVQSNYFATKLDLAQLKNEMLVMKIELKKYADEGDRELLHNLDTKYQLILSKLDKLK